MLAQQIEQSRLHRGDGVDGGAQVKGLQATSARVAVGKTRVHAVEHGLHLAQALADHQLGSVLQGGADFFAAGHFTNAGASRTVGEDEQVAGEKRTVRTREVEQHAVMPGHGDDAQLGDDGRGVGHGCEAL